MSGKHQGSNAIPAPDNAVNFMEIKMPPRLLRINFFINFLDKDTNIRIDINISNEKVCLLWKISTIK